MWGIFGYFDSKDCRNRFQKPKFSKVHPYAFTEHG